MSVSPRFKEELRNRIVLSELIGRRVRLTRAGREFKGCCPFHKEKTPSFYVNDDKQFYHCFGCGAHGDAIEFLMANQNLSFIEAVEQLAAQAGMAVPKSSPEDVRKAKEEKDLYSLLEEAGRFFVDSFATPAGDAALSYLRERGLSAEMIDAFRLGYAPADRQALRRFLSQRGYTDAQMRGAGLLRQADRGGEPYAFFRDRIMFPVTDRRGRIVAFGGRILPAHLRPAERGDFKPPKYINSPDTALFHKGRMLYNESHARQAAGDGHSLIVVEGYLDVIACAEAGFSGALAPLGTALTEEQIARLWRMIPAFPKSPVLCFDGDGAGRRAAARACERILPLLLPDQSVRIAFLPQGEDPDTLIRTRGREAFRDVLDAALPMADFLWMSHTSGRALTTPEARAGLEKTLEEEIARIADRSVQAHYRRLFKDRVFQAFSPARFQPRRSPGAQRQSGAVALRKPEKAPDVTAHHVLLATLLNHPALFDSVEEICAGMLMPNKRLDSLRQLVLHLLGSEPDLDRAALRHHLCERGYEAELALLAGEGVYTHAGFARPQADFEKARDGFFAFVKGLEGQESAREYKAGWHAVRNDLTAENEERALAWHHLHREGEEEASKTF
ncbi:MAG: DNA primase [Alphaproteobacteria bacterium]|nr:DNA primase [Alphaproteobacteria bacterium]